MNRESKYFERPSTSEKVFDQIFGLLVGLGITSLFYDIDGLMHYLRWVKK